MYETRMYYVWGSGIRVLKRAYVHETRMYYVWGGVIRVLERACSRHECTMCGVVVYEC